MYKRILVLFLYIGFAVQSHASNDFFFRNFSTKQGLSHETVYALEQDRRGYIWIGTQVGLNRFDGEEFRTYYHDPDDASTLSGSNIFSLRCTAKGELYIGTRIGLSKYVPESDSFINYKMPSGDTNIYDIIELPDSRGLLLGAQDGLFLFDSSNGGITSISSTCGNVLSLCNFRKDAILVGTSTGAYFYYIPNRSLTQVFRQLENESISDISFDPVKETIWIATMGKGLFRADRNFQIKNSGLKNESSYPIQNVRRVETDSEGRIWAGTMNGAYCAESDTSEFVAVKLYREDKKDSDVSIRSILRDRDGGIWIGSFTDGCFTYNKRRPGFQAELLPEGFSAGSISCVAYDKRDGTVWLGHSVYGLFTYNPEKKQFSRFPVKGVRNNIKRIKCILPPADVNGQLYVGTHLDGIFRIDTKTGLASSINLHSNVPEFKSVYSLYDTGDGKILVGSGSGLLILDKSTGTAIRVTDTDSKELERSLVGDIRSDKDGRIWLATDKGVFVSDGKGRDFVQIKYPATEGETSIPARELIYSPGNDAIYINSTNGFFKYAVKEEKFTKYPVDSGLPWHSLNGMAEDSMGNIWMNSNRGIICLNPEYNSYRIYTEKDGVLPDEYSSSRFISLEDGTFICNGSKGLNMFMPGLFHSYVAKPTPAISQCFLQNRPVKDRPEGTEIICNSYGEPSSISYPSDYSGLSVKLSAIDLYSGSAATFAYKLDGIDKEWTHTNVPYVTYPRLSAGKYRLLATILDSNGQVDRNYATLEIHVLPKWYETWQFKASAVLLAIIIILAVIVFFINYSRKQASLVWEQKDKQRMQDVNDEKIRFYTNISHELRTPINLILSPLEEISEMAKELPREIGEKIRFIYRNSRKLDSIICQELDLRRTESDILPLGVSRNDIAAIVNDVYSAFYYEFERRKQSVSIANELSEPEIWCDRSYIEKILYNLLANAVKFTPEKGTIAISMREDGDMLSLAVENSGKGISEKELDMIFERFYKADENSRGYGIGLAIIKNLVQKHHGSIAADSIPGQKTRFTVRIPMKESFYSEEEKDSSRQNHALFSFINDGYFIDEQEVPDAGHIADTQRQEDAGRPNILLATDKQDMEDYMRNFFEKEYNITVFNSPDKLPAVLKNNATDLVICDFSMNSNALEQFCRSIKRNIQTAHIPLIVLSDKGGQDVKLRFLKAGVDEYITKPVSIHLLSAKVRNILMQYNRLSLHISNISGRLKPDGPATMYDADKEFIDKVVKIIDDNLTDENFSPEDLADILNISRSNLYMRMNEIMGEAPANFIKRRRIDMACQYLSEGRYRVSEISDMVGFSSASYFTSCFKKQKGCLPTEYVRKTENDLEKTKDRRPR